MSDRAKEIFLKVLVVTGLVGMLGSTIGFGIMGMIFGDSNPIVCRIWICIFAPLFVIPGVLVIVLILVFSISGSLPVKKVKADKIPIHTNAEIFMSLFFQALNENGFFQQGEPASFEKSTMCLFADQKHSLNEDVYFSVIRAEELSDDLLQKMNDKITELLTIQYGSIASFPTILMISVFCVDRVTPSFHGLVDSNMNQGLKNGRLVVGVSFDDGNLYLANQKDGFGISRYKKMRKIFMSVFETLNITQV